MAEDFLDELVVFPLAGEIPEEMREPAFFEKIKEERDAIVTIAIRSYECCHKMSGRFSGYYPVNCIPLPPPCEKICTNKEEAVQQFAETRCERNKETGTDATLLYDRFIREYGVTADQHMLCVARQIPVRLLLSKEGSLHVDSLIQQRNRIHLEGRRAYFRPDANARPYQSGTPNPYFSLPQSINFMASSSKMYCNNCRRISFPECTDPCIKKSDLRST